MIKMVSPFHHLYKPLLNKFESELLKLRTAITGKYIREDYLRLLYSLEFEICIMDSRWKDMNNYLEGIELF